MRIEGNCLICGGSPTVKAHLFPRSLIHEIRRDSPHVIAVGPESDKFDFQQSGEWDNKILCHNHEVLLGKSDAYSVNIIREINKIQNIKPKNDIIEIENVDKNHLLFFAYTTLWKFCSSTKYPSLKIDIGPYYDLLTNIIVNNGPYDIQVFLSTSRFELKNSGRINIAIAPFKNRFEGINIWTFCIGKVEFYIKMDKRAFGKPLDYILIGKNKNLKVVNSSGQNILGIPVLRPIMNKMRDLHSKSHVEHDPGPL